MKKDWKDNERLQLFSAYSVQTELLTLLAHELGHHSISVTSSIEELARKLRSAFGDHPLYKHIEPNIERAVELSLALTSAINNIRKFRYFGEQESRFFDVHYLLEDCYKLFHSTLERHKMRMIIKKRGGKIETIGAKEVLELIIYNLIINSIDAQRLRRKPKPNTIRISLELEHESFVIKYQDDGPGINQSVFRDPSEIFDLGTTTKHDSTGAGLAVARQLLQRNFGGEISLLEPAKALFVIRCPLRHSYGEI